MSAILVGSKMETADGAMLGRSPAFRHALQLIHRAARWDATVLLQGETGTGKELAAHAIHYESERRAAPFIPLNCGGVPDTLIESELFGYARGAFTDARAPRCGLIAEAEGGTLFLDEVDSLSPKAQVTLLRFLQDGVYRPLGSAHMNQGNVRIIAATNTNLAELCERSAFRRDLYYRLCLLCIELPPLRQRGADVYLLTDYFLDRFCAMYQAPRRRVSADMHDWLGRYTWPGNVRELENLLHREFLVGESEFIEAPASIDCSTARAPAGSCTLQGFSAAKAEALRSFEKNYLTRAIAEAQGNVSAAARRSGKERRSFGKLLKKYGIDPATFVSPK
jgi:transcriptional regulator with PAS, ATPase and Fis domain